MDSSLYKCGQTLPTFVLMSKKEDIEPKLYVDGLVIIV